MTTRGSAAPGSSRKGSTAPTGPLLGDGDAVRVEHGHRTEPERRDTGADLREVAHHDDGELPRLEVAPRHPAHVGRLHRRDAGEVGGDLRLGQPEEGEVGELRRHRAIGLDPPRVGADEHALGELDFLGRRRAGGADVVQLAEELHQRAVGLGGEDAGAGDERPVAAIERPCAPRAVGEALRLAQVEVDPAGELPAEDHVHLLERIEVGIGGARGAGVADADLALRGARLVHQVHRRGPRRGAGGHGGRFRRQRSLLPSTERTLGVAHPLLGGEVADDHHDGVVGPVEAPVEAGDVVAGDGADRGGRAVARPAVGMGIAVHLPREGLRGDDGGLVLLLAERLQARLAVALQLLGGEGGPGHQLAHEGEGGVRRALERGEPERGEGPVAPGEGAEADAQRVHGAREVERGPGAGALVEQRGSHGGEPVLRAVMRPAGADHQRRAHRRQLALGDGPDLEPVGERPLGHRRRRDAGRRAGGGALGAVEGLREGGRTEGRKGGKQHRRPEHARHPPHA
jgi:hypothetical protein